MSVVSGIVGAVTAKSASNTQADAARDSAAAQLEATKLAIASQEKMFDLSRADTAPWRETGENALAALQQKVTEGPGDYTKSPGYDFRLAEGQKAIERSAAARGNLLGGATAKALTRYGQDYATNDYDNFLQRYYQSLSPLQSLSGVGQTTAMQGASQANQVGANIGNTQMAGGNAIAAGYTNAGNAIAAGQINQANAITGAIQSGTNSALTAYGLWQMGALS